MADGRKRSVSQSELSSEVALANTQQDVLLRRRTRALGRSQKTVAASISLHQKAVYRDFQKALRQSCTIAANISQDRALLGEIRWAGDSGADGSRVEDDIRRMVSRGRSGAEAVTKGVVPSRTEDRGERRCVGVRTRARPMTCTTATRTPPRTNLTQTERVTAATRPATVAVSTRHRRPVVVPSATNHDDVPRSEYRDELRSKSRTNGATRESVVFEESDSELECFNRPDRVSTHSTHRRLSAPADVRRRAAGTATFRAWSVLPPSDQRANKTRTAENDFSERVREFCSRVDRLKAEYNYATDYYRTRVLASMSTCRRPIAPPPVDVECEQILLRQRVKSMTVKSINWT